jgi:transcriptional regulator with AAA-type ATPase domain
MAYDWPGNIRELQNVVERGVILCDGDIFCIDESWLKPDSLPRPARIGPLAALAEREKEMIEAALAECNGRISGPCGAAALRQIPRQTLESKSQTSVSTGTTLRLKGLSKHPIKLRRPADTSLSVTRHEIRSYAIGHVNCDCSPDLGRCRRMAVKPE